jgi:hypothetical protein
MKIVCFNVITSQVLQIQFELIWKRNCIILVLASNLI